MTTGEYVGAGALILLTIGGLAFVANKLSSPTQAPMQGSGGGGTVPADDTVGIISRLLGGVTSGVVTGLRSTPPPTTATAGGTPGAQGTYASGARWVGCTDLSAGCVSSYNAWRSAA